MKTATGLWSNFSNLLHSLPGGKWTIIIGVLLVVWFILKIIKKLFMVAIIVGVFLAITGGYLTSGNHKSVADSFYKAHSNTDPKLSKVYAFRKDLHGVYYYDSYKYCDLKSLITKDKMLSTVPNSPECI
jgi:hypothetical protein